VILVLGGAGYVGSVLVEALLDQGYSVRVYDREYYNVDDSKFSKKADYVWGDVRDIHPETFNDIDAVINLSGLSNDPTAEYNPEANKEMNTEATISSAKQAIGLGIMRYVFASSCSVYYRDISGTDADDVILDENSSIQPKAAYSKSKYEAEQGLIQLSNTNKGFCPVILRKGTIFGWSPRMRYDLVVNTFVKDALKTGKVNIHNGGEMWRPMLEINDAARAYIACLQAKAPKVRGQIFNVAYKNFRVSEIALRTVEALKKLDINVEIEIQNSLGSVRSYRVSLEKAHSVLGITPSVTIGESVANMVTNIKDEKYTDWDNPIYANIKWMKTLEHAERIMINGKVF
jgi:nucleoside-diphosphate-sugar epimerase